MSELVEVTISQAAWQSLFDQLADYVTILEDNHGRNIILAEVGGKQFALVKEELIMSGQPIIAGQFKVAVRGDNAAPSPDGDVTYPTREGAEKRIGQICEADLYWQDKLEVVPVP